MPYKKGSIAEQNAKVRRTAKRRIARLEKEIQKSSSDKERQAFQQQIDSMREQISRTYQRDPYSYKATGYTDDELKMARQNLARSNAASKIGQGSQSRKNFLTQQELNMASTASGAQIGEFTREEVSQFYAATQKAWENLPSTANRNQAILDYYGEKDLRSFVRKVLKALDIKRRKQEDESEYSDESEVESTSDQSAKSPSAEWIAYIIQFNAEQLRDILEDMDE